MADDKNANNTVRLFACNTPCKIVQEIPWYPMNGPRENDDTLNYRYADHPPERGHMPVWGDVPKAQWENPALRPAILEKLAESTPGGASEGLGSGFYDLKSTFAEDAMTCWKQHNRTKNCQDYMSDSKRLTPPTRGERKELGISKRSPVSTRLCQFCPYNSIVMQRFRADRGDYDYSG